jgi:hypothetical protein
LRTVYEQERELAKLSRRLKAARATLARIGFGAWRMLLQHRNQHKSYQHTNPDLPKTVYHNCPMTIKIVIGQFLPNLYPIFRRLVAKVNATLQG